MIHQSLVSQESPRNVLELICPVDLPEIGGDGGAGLGGGIFASQSQPALETNVVSGNTVMGGGVGLAATNGVKGLAKGPNVYFGTVLIPVALHTVSLESNPKKVG